MRVTIISEYYSSALEDSINAWLTRNCKVKVIDIKYSVADRESLYQHNAMIIYEE